MPIVEITEHTDYETYRKFFFFVNRRRPIMWASWLLYYALIPVTLLFLVIFAFLADIPLWIWVGVPLWIAGLIANVTAPRRMFKRSSGRCPLVTTTAFFEDYFAYNASGQGLGQSASIDYSHVARAYETVDAFYLHYTEKGWGFFPKKFFAPPG